MYMGVVEGNGPDGEKLGHLEVELLVGFVICYVEFELLATR